MDVTHLAGLVAEALVQPVPHPVTLWGVCGWSANSRCTQYAYQVMQMCATHQAWAGMLLVDKQAVTSGFMGHTVIPPQQRIQGAQPASCNTSMDSPQQDL